MTNVATEAIPPHHATGDRRRLVVLEFDTEAERQLIASLSPDQLETVQEAAEVFVRAKADEIRRRPALEEHHQWCQTHQNGCQSEMVGFGADGFAFVTADERGVLLNVARMDHQGPDGAVAVPLTDARDMLDEIAGLLDHVETEG